MLSGRLGDAMVHVTKLERQQPASDSVQAPWFALRVRSRAERKVSQALQQKGFEQFLPAYPRRSYWSDRVKMVSQPLFPGYVFCRYRPKDTLAVLQTPGVVAAVGFGRCPAAVPEAEIASLRKLVESTVPLFPRAFLHVGQKILVNRGPLAGVEGILEQFEKGCRVVVSVTLLQRSVSAEVDAECVTPAGAGRNTASRAAL